MLGGSVAVDLPVTRMERLAAGLNYLFLAGMLVAVAGVLTAAMVIQFARGELPCPLCLLQRVALFGVGFALMQNFRVFSHRNTGIGLLFALLLLIVSVRQTLLDIVPRPDHAYVGSAILGLHMPVWSVIIATVLIAAQAIALALFGGERRVARLHVEAFPALARVADFAAAYLIVLAVINLAAVVVQCGFGACHTDGYKLIRLGLEGLWAP
jgi:disulfide bond formation protein DsbB